MSAPRAVALSSPPFAVGMVVTGLVCQELGASLAVLLFPALGPLGIVFLRLGFSAVILMVIARPRLRGHTPPAWRSVVGRSPGLQPSLAAAGCRWIGIG